MKRILLSVLLIFHGLIHTSKNPRYTFTHSTESQSVFGKAIEKVPYIGAAWMLYQMCRSEYNPLLRMPDDPCLWNEYAQEKVCANNASQEAACAHAIQSSQELYAIYEEYGMANGQDIRVSVQAWDDIQRDGYIYSTRSYLLSPASIKMLNRAGDEGWKYSVCYGNQLQQALHERCIHILERTAGLSSKSPFYDYKDALLDLTDSARAYNQAGYTAHASTILDFCSTFLDYGQAIVEGAVLGLKGAAQDIVEHPIQAALCAVAGEYVLAYQLSKLLFTVADLGILAIVNPKKSSEKLDTYLEPLYQLISAIENKEIGMRDAIKGSTALAVGWKAQNKMLGGLGKMCKTAQLKAIKFAKKHPAVTPQEYLATPEGFVLKAADNIGDPNRPSTGIHGGIQNSIENNIPGFIKEKRVPKDFETILHSLEFKKTNIQKIKGALVYKKGNHYYHRDTFHVGEAAHLEVYNKRGEHIGEADAITGTLRSNSADKNKKIHW